VRIAAEHPHIVRGIKCHWESGGLSHWGPAVLKKAADAGRAANLPLYVHTGELFPVDEANRPNPSAVMGQVVSYLKPGDTLAHIYSRMPDGIMSIGEEVPPWLFEAKAAGVLFDLGHGVNLSFKIARKMMEKGVFPDTIGSDVHGDFCAYHDFSILDYSLIGGMNKLLGLGMSLTDVVRAATATPARVLADPSIGHLGPGARANVTVLRPVEGEWTFFDSVRERLAGASVCCPISWSWMARSCCPTAGSWLTSWRRPSGRAASPARPTSPALWRASRRNDRTASQKVSHAPCRESGRSRPAGDCGGPAGARRERYLHHRFRLQRPPRLLLRRARARLLPAGRPRRHIRARQRLGGRHPQGRRRRGTVGLCGRRLAGAGARQ
jgi:Amidohydrolase family